VVLASLEIIEISGVPCIVAFSRDITERRAMEERLRQSQKMEAVGRLAGGIAHDFNNILTVISGYAELLRDRKDPSIAEEAGSIVEAADRAASLTRQLLAFGRQQVLEPRVIHLNDIVRSMEKMLRRLIGEDIELVTVLAQDAGAVQADPSQIEQIIMNLAVNARDAMPSGGRIILETMNTELSHSYVQELREVEPGNYVMLAVSDTGTGMDAQTQAQIFEPFFTTKEMGRGTGLGLSTVYGIVTQSQGHIWVYSEVGHGTTFKIYLPRVEEPARVERQEPQPAGAARGAETILLVEDDRALRNLAVKILRREGYTVLEAEGSLQAEEICRRHQGQIDLILTDMVMPQMSGHELAKRVRSLRPHMRVLYMSGYTEYAASQRPGFELDAPLLSKPFTSVTLSSKIREVLQQPAA
jgi:nitrogen-specific signal transduction histidine kinase